MMTTEKSNTLLVQAMEAGNTAFLAQPILIYKKVMKTTCLLPTSHSSSRIKWVLILSNHQVSTLLLKQVV